MKNGAAVSPRNIITVVASMLVGMVMPYISRIPLAATYGTQWIWNYISSSGDFWRWNGFHVFSLVPIGIFGLLYIFSGYRYGFYASVVGHFAATSFIYYDFGVHHGPDDFLGCLLFPPMLAVVSFVAGGIALVAETIIERKAQTINDIA
jgi:hypothetical protein